MTEKKKEKEEEEEKDWSWSILEVGLSDFTGILRKIMCNKFIGKQQKFIIYYDFQFSTP